MHNYYALPIYPSHVSAVHLSGKNIQVSVPSLWPAHSSSGIHKDTEASADSVAIHGYPGCDLYRQHVITPPTEKVLQKIFSQVVDLLCSPIPCQCPIFLGAVLDSTTMTLSLPKPKLTKQGSWFHQFITEVFNTYTYKQCRIMGMQGKR